MQSPNETLLKLEDKQAVEKVRKSMKVLGDHYQVAIPWKDEDVVLPNNYKMALSQLHSTERKLKKCPEIAVI